MLVSGVRSSWETVETNASLARSSSWSRRTDSRCCSKARTCISDDTRSWARPAQIASARGLPGPGQQRLEQQPAHHLVAHRHRARRPASGRRGTRRSRPAPSAPSRGVLVDVVDLHRLEVLGRLEEQGRQRLGKVDERAGSGQRRHLLRRAPGAAHRGEPLGVDEQHVAAVDPGRASDGLRRAVDQVRRVEVLGAAPGRARRRPGPGRPARAGRPGPTASRARSRGGGRWPARPRSRLPGAGHARDAAGDAGGVPPRPDPSTRSMTTAGPCASLCLGSRADGARTGVVGRAVRHRSQVWNHGGHLHAKSPERSPELPRY